MTGSEIATIRKALGLSQQELAAVMGYGNKVRISELERGKREIGPAAERLLDAYLKGYRPDDWPKGK